jgi:acyl phosphate:glycerol-3-phosphate acyltransferase
MQTLDIVRAAVALILGYLVGGVPFGIIVPRIIGGPDPRTIGSGRTGGANVSRAVGYRWAAVSGLLDVAKGAAVVLAMMVVGGDAVAQVFAALAAVVGHSRSPYIAFHGGRGVAPASGGALIIAPYILAAILPVFAISIAITRISSIGSLSASLVGGIAMIVVAAVTGLPPIYYVYGVGVPGLIWLFHWDNIGRLISGTERRMKTPGTGEGSQGADGSSGAA